MDTVGSLKFDVLYTIFKSGGRMFSAMDFMFGV